MFLRLRFRLVNGRERRPYCQSLRQRLPLRLRGEGQREQAQEEHRAHGHAGVAHRLVVAGEDLAGEQAEDEGPAAATRRPTL